MRQFIAVAILISLIVLLYLNFDDWNRDFRKQASLSDNVIDKDEILPLAEMDYEALMEAVKVLQKSPDQLMKFNVMLMSVLYGGKVNDEEVETLTNIQRSYFHKKLLDTNPATIHLERILEEVNRINITEEKIIGSTVLAPEFDPEDKNKAAIKVVFFPSSVGKSTNIYQQYFLLKDETGFWTIYGWQSVDPFNFAN